jgi:hypothetical protein
VGWESGSLYGLLLGKGDLESSLAGRRCTAPLQVPVSEGQFRRLADRAERTPARLLVDKGQLIDNAHLAGTVPDVAQVRRPAAGRRHRPRAGSPFC